MIPGSIEVSDNVLEATAHPSLLHTHQPFIGIFQQVLKKLRVLFKSKALDSQAFVLSGSGTLGWDIVASNLVEPGEKALVLSTGFFSDNFAECLKTYGASVDVLKAPLGGVVALAEVETALKKENYKIITITHVDTLTAVVSDIAKISAIVKKVSPETLVVVDGVCSVAVEDIEFDQWGLDFVLTASQKALGVPPGLSVNFASGRAVKTAVNRLVQSTYFASLKRWLPIMEAYESGKGAYLATPSVQLINALNTSLDEILSVPLEERFAKHAKNSDWFKSELKKHGLKLVSNDDCGSHALTAVYFPEGTNGADFFGKVTEAGLVFAGGIHKSIAGKYFRVGHMGVSVMDRDDTKNALDVILKALGK